MDSLALNSIPANYTLKDFDWSLRYTVSSDRHGSLGQPVLLLQLQLQPSDQITDDSSPPNHSSTVTRLVELLPEDLDQAIADLEGAQKVLMKLSM
mmetsp:Transcript_3349/g.4915  ORF Transcript_3349/g.4915 Transcript_3349/m.4915 type:complete len:95 (+) Transcript_3349:122-406(+)